MQYNLRPSVGGPTKIWDKYPISWPEVYYSVNLSELGQKQIELLHSRSSDIKIKMFAPSNANIGRSGFQTTNLKTCENGTTDLVTKDDWLNIVTVNELMMHTVLIWSDCLV